MTEVPVTMAPALVVNVTVALLEASVLSFASAIRMIGWTVNGTPAAAPAASCESSSCTPGNGSSTEHATADITVTARRSRYLIIGPEPGQRACAAADRPRDAHRRPTDD